MCADLCNELPDDVKRLTTLMSSTNETEDNVSTVLEQYERLGFPPAQLERMIYRYVFFHLPACSAYRFLWTYIPPIIILLGSFGNILAFMVLRHPSTRYVSAFVYLTVRSVVDEVVLTVGLLRRWIDYMINRKLEHSTSVFCKLAQFAGVSSSFLSVWLTVTLTAERALVVSFPLHGTRFISYSRVRKLIIVLSLICILLSLHFFITVDLIPTTTTPSSSTATTDFIHQPYHSLYLEPQDSNTTEPWRNQTQSAITGDVSSVRQEMVYQCNFKPEFASFAWLWTTIDAVVYCYLPFILIFGLNVVIVYHVNAAQKKQHRIRVRHSVIPMQQLSKATGASGDQMNNVRQMTIMLLVVSFAFLVTTVAIVVTKILSQVLDLSGSGRTHERLYFQLADTVAELLMYINHAMNFYLFCATGKRFRSRLWYLLAKCRPTAPNRGTADQQQTARLDPDCHYPTCSNPTPRTNGPNIFTSNSIRKTLLNPNGRSDWIENVVCNPPCTRCQSAPPYGRSVNYSSGSVVSNTTGNAYVSLPNTQHPSTLRNPLSRRLTSHGSQRPRFRNPFTKHHVVRLVDRSTGDSQWSTNDNSTHISIFSCFKQHR